MIGILFLEAWRQTRAGWNAHGQRFQRIDPIAEISDLVDENMAFGFSFDGLLVGQVFDEHKFDGIFLFQFSDDGYNDVAAFGRPIGGRMADPQQRIVTIGERLEFFGIEGEKNVVNAGMKLQVVEFDGHIDIGDRIDGRNNAPHPQVAAPITADDLFAHVFPPQDIAAVTEKAQAAIELDHLILVELITLVGLFDDRPPDRFPNLDQYFLQRIRSPNRWEAGQFGFDVRDRGSGLPADHSFEKREAPEIEQRQI